MGFARLAAAALLALAGGFALPPSAYAQTELTLVGNLDTSTPNSTGVQRTENAQQLTNGSAAAVRLSPDEPAIATTPPVTRAEGLPTVTVAAAAGGETVTEGTDAAFTLSRTGSTAAVLTVTVAVSETGSVLKDASAVPSSVTFAAGAATATLALATDDDDTDDDDGTVTVTLGTDTGYTVGEPGAATVAVSDNDVPVDFVLAVPATVAEDAGPVTVTVTATTAENAPPVTPVEVQLSRVGGTSTSGSDHDAVSETVRFQVSDFAPATVDGQPRYQAEWTHDVVIHDDEVVEGDETLVLAMSPTPAFLLILTLHGGIDAVRATLTIVDNDPPVVTIAADADVVGEDSGAAGFTLSRSGPTEASLTVTVAVTQEADRDLLPDGAAAQRTVTFAAGSTTTTLTVTLTLDDDDLAGTSGVLTVQVQEGDGYTVGTPSSAAVTITDGDTGTLPPAGLAASAGPRAGEVVLTWDAVALWLEFRGHQYRYKTDGGYGNWTDIPDSGPRQANGTGWSVRGLAAGQVHTFQVRAYETPPGGDPVYGDASDEASATPLAGPDGFCDRTAEIRDAIVSAATGIADCAEITETQLGQMTTLSLFAVSIPALAADDLVGLSGLVTLNLSYTGLTRLPPTVFDDLTSLDNLWLNNNQLQTLPAGIFAGLTGLDDLRLASNPGFPFGPVAEAGPTFFVSTDREVTLRGSGGSDPWGRSVTYAWTQSDSSGVVVPLDGDTTATPSLTAPAVEQETVFRFKLTVTAVNPGGVAPPGTTTAGDSATDSTPVRVQAAVPVSVYFHQARYVATEGGRAARVAIRLDKIPRRSVSIPLQAVPAAGADAADYSIPASVTFGFVDRVKYVTVTATDDSVDDDGESLTLSFGDSLPVAVARGSPSSVTVELADNDAPVGVRISGLSVTSDPGTDSVYVSGDTLEVTATFGDTVTVSGRPRLALSVGTSITESLGRAERNAGYVRGSGTTKLVFAYGVVEGDDDPDGVSVASGSLDLNGGSVQDGDGTDAVVAHGGLALQPGHRVDALAPTLGEAFVDGSGLTLRYSEPLDEISVPPPTAFSVSVGGASRTVSAVGVSGQLVSVTLATAVQPGEQASVGYTLPATGSIRDKVGLAATAFSNQSATNYTLPTVSIAAVDPNVYEGTDVDFTLTRNGPTIRSLQATVRVQESGDVLLGTSGDKNVTFAADDSTAWLTLKTHDNHEYEAHATISATVIGGAYHVSETAGTASVTVSDNDLPEIDVTLSAPDSVAEEVDTFVVQVSARTISDEEPHGSLSVRLRSSDRTAEAGSDYSSVSETVRFLPADFTRIEEGGDGRYVATASPAVTIFDDSMREGDETFALELTRPGVIADDVNLPSEPLVVTIVDNEVRPELSVANAEAAEGSPVTFTVTLAATSTRAVTATWTASIEGGDTAEAKDLESTTGTVTVAASQTTATFTVPTADDSTDEDNETFTLTLSSPSSNATLATDATATGTITDDDAAPTISVEDQTVNEGDQNPDNIVDVEIGFPFRATLSAASEKQVRFKVRLVELASDTATDADLVDGNLFYEAAAISPGDTVSFEAGDVIRNDAFDEPDETFTLEIYDFVNATAGAKTRSTITIEDDDDPPSVSVGDATATEGDPVEFAVTLSAASGWEVTVDWATSAETGATAATSGTDFTAASDTLTLMPGETTATFTVATEQDTVDEDNETFTVTLSNPSDAMLVTDPTATGTIDDDDDPATLGFEDDAEASEGDDVTFTLTLSPVSDREVTVHWATSVETGDTATSGTDFTAVSAATLTLMPGETTATFTVQTTADSTSEDNETFTVTLSKPSNATLAADPTATGTIGDDDAFAQPQTSCAPNPDDIWCGVVTVMEYSIGGESYDGFLESPESVAGDLSEKNFTYGENRYTIDAILVGKPTGDGEGRFLFSLTSELTQSDKAALVLYVGSTAIPFAVSHYFSGGGGHWYFWEGDAAQEGSLLTPGPGLDWRSETTVTVRLREASTTCTPQGAIWCGVVTPGDLAGEYGFLNQIGLLSDTDFEHDRTPYTIDEVSVSDSGQLRFSLTADLTAAHRAALALHVDGSSGSFALQSASHVAGSNTYAWLDTGLDWSSVPPVTLRLRHTAPTFPGKPTNLTATGNGSTQIDLGWDAPDPGTAAITGYRIEVWADAVTGWTDLVANTGNADTTYAHTGLSAGDTRHYRVSAINTNGTSVPSDERSATTLTNVPVFTDTTATRMVAENSAADTNVGDAFREATDADGDPLTYSMEGTDTASFTFYASTRQIKTKTGVTYNFEAKNTYSVTVKADDGTGGTDTIAVTITLTNVDEGQSGTVSIGATAPMVGDELTASTAEVDDPDGLPDPFAPAWQWYRTPSGGSETEIAGESSATYTVVEADLGAALTAKASWTDLGGFSNTLASTATAAVTPLPTVTVAAATGGETVAEGTDAAFTLSRTGATTAALAVAVAVSETGAVLDDAAASPSSVTFDVGSDEATLALATDDDDTDDDDGTVTVTLGTGTGYTVGEPGAATVAVSDNDVPVDFVLAVPATVAEDAGPATVTVTATTAENAPPATAVEVQLAGVGGTATGGSDYDAVSETARFQVSDFAAATVDGQPRYQAEWTHDVVIHDDDVVEGDETLVLAISPTPAFLLIHTLDGGHDAVQATLTIVDNDAANVAPSFTSPETFTPEENQTTVGTVAASDDDTGDDITGYALSGGAGPGAVRDRRGRPAR